MGIGSYLKEVLVSFAPFSISKQDIPLPLCIIYYLQICISYFSWVQLKLDTVQTDILSFSCDINSKINAYGPLAWDKNKSVGAWNIFLCMWLPKTSFLSFICGIVVHFICDNKYRGCLFIMCCTGSASSNLVNILLGALLILRKPF